jgi:penicillin-binding protein 2
MSRKQIKNPQQETRIFQSRIVASILIIVLLIGTIFTRYFYLQIIQHQSLLANSEQNRIKTTSIPPARGFIYDRNGQLLVENIPTYRLQVIPEKVDDIKKNLNELKELVHLTDDDIEDLMKKKSLNRPFKPLIVKNKLNEKELASFMVRKHLFIGFKATPYLIRHYKYTDILAHVVGYVGRINDKDLKRLDNRRYKGSEYTGKLGLERFHENQLHGFPGSLTVETNAQGRVLKTIEQTPPISGQDISLTIDIELQKTAYEALGELTGSAIAINPKNGEILAMVSKPGFDPNDFVNGITHKKYNRLINSNQKPLFNRSLRGGYEPGSTIKPYMALAGLYYKVINLNYTMFSKGYFQLDNQARKYHDWKRGGHGLITIKQSLVQSVNTFYYQLAVLLGIDRIHEFLKPFKFGELSQVDLLAEKRGLLPSREWKKAIKGKMWFPGETVITGIGQGFLVATPIQLATSLTILANKGSYFKPHLIKSEKPELTKIPFKIPESHWNIVHQGMIGVVHDKKGTARSIKNKKYLIAGKSGTSQVYGKKEEDVYNKNLEIPLHLRNHALFIAFAPADNPKIAVVVVAEHGASGSKTAAPIAGKIIDKYLNEIVIK